MNGKISSIRSLSRSWRRRCAPLTATRITALTWAPTSRSPSRTARARTATKNKSQSPNINDQSKIACCRIPCYSLWRSSSNYIYIKLFFFFFFFFKIKYFLKIFKIVCFVKPFYYYYYYFSPT